MLKLVSTASLSALIVGNVQTVRGGVQLELAF
jgi:hypothetical protein